MNEEEDVPAHRYTSAVADRIETAWQDRWEADGTFATPNPSGPLSDGFDRVALRPRAYILDMFPYPSGAGLHVGHPLGYIGTDTTRGTGGCAVTTSCTRWASTRSGCPPSSARSQTGSTPARPRTRTSTSFLRQLRRLGFGHDTRRRVATTDPEFYRWTQWIFLRIFNSWYDTALDKARPIEELVAELAAGTRQPPGGSRGRIWTSVARRRVIDDHRLAYLLRGAGELGAWAGHRRSPTRRSLPTGAASAATSRCSASPCASG